MFKKTKTIWALKRNFTPDTVYKAMVAGVDLTYKELHFIGQADDGSLYNGYFLVYATRNLEKEISIEVYYINGLGIPSMFFNAQKDSLKNTWHIFIPDKDKHFKGKIVFGEKE